MKISRLILAGVLLLIGLSLDANAQQQPSSYQPDAKNVAYFFLSSDEIRALRNTSPTTNLILKWKKHIDILTGKSDKVADTSGTLSLGPDYLVWRKSGGEVTIVDFALHRMFIFTPGKPHLENYSLFAWTDFLDREAINRAYLSRITKALKLKQTVPGHVQYLYEASLGVSTPNITPITTSVTTKGNSLSIHYKNKEIATAKFSQTVLTTEQSTIFAKALRYFLTIHPAALNAMLPLKRLPLEVSSIHAFHVKSKARTTIQFELMGASEADYPLPGGLKPDVHDTQGISNKSVEKFLTSVTDTALSAVAGTYSKPRPRLDDFIADATQAYAKGDRLESGLAWLAADLQFPEQIAACASPSKPGYCKAYHEQMNAAKEDPHFKRVIEGSLDCTRHKPEKGARALASVDITGKPHGYVVSTLLFCTLADLPSKKINTIAGIGTKHPASALENALNAIQANPYITSTYYDIGIKFAAGYMSNTAWRLFDLGLALGGGIKGDAFDKHLRVREKVLQSRHPLYF